jgi:hypothetical protein
MTITGPVAPAHTHTYPPRTSPMKGLSCHVLRPVRNEEVEAVMYPTGRTRNYPTDTLASVTLCGEGIVDLVEPTESQPAFVLVKRNLFGGEHLHAEPAGLEGTSFGGNFIFSSDGRFPSKYPIPVHDRVETPFK